MCREGPYSLTVVEQHCEGCRYHSSRPRGTHPRDFARVKAGGVIEAQSLLSNDGSTVGCPPSAGAMHECWHPSVTEKPFGGILRGEDGQPPLVGDRPRPIGSSDRTPTWCPCPRKEGV